MRTAATLLLVATVLGQAHGAERSPVVATPDEAAHIETLRHRAQREKTAGSALVGIGVANGVLSLATGLPLIASNASSCNSTASCIGSSIANGILELTAMTSGAIGFVALAVGIPLLLDGRHKLRAPSATRAVHLFPLPVAGGAGVGARLSF